MEISQENLENLKPVNGVLLDKKLNIKVIGNFKGSIITKVLDKNNSIIFSDAIKITDNNIEIKGLKIGTGGKLANSNQGNFIFKDTSKIHYSVKIDEETIQMFDGARFGASFPYMISLLNTHLLLDNKHKINHTDFVLGEIINHPIGLSYNDSIIVGDRLVIDNFKNAIFYDAFIIKRNSVSDSDETISFENEPLEIVYEPIFRMNINFFEYIINLGVENLK
jgi:hypothetical protein